MPSKKTKKRREKKSRLTDKDIIKLIKKLRPKNQQIVRVNVGDKGGDKKKERVLQPNIVPVLSYAAPQQQQQQQYLPPPLPMSQQPQLQPLIIPPPAPRIPTRIPTPAPESESETPIKARKPRAKKSSTIASDFLGEEIRHEQEKARELYEYENRNPYERQFKNPKRLYESSLSSESSLPTRFAQAVQNDPYLPPVFEDTSADSAGVIASSLPSDQWTGTPEGEFELQTMQGSEAAAALATAEPTAAAATEQPLETVSAPEESFTGRTIGSQSVVEKIRSIPTAAVFGEEEPDWTKSMKSPDILPPIPPESRTVDPYIFNPLYETDYLNNMLRDAPMTAQGLMKNEIVEKLKGGYQFVPKEYLTKTGRLKTKIPPNELFTLYTGLK